MASSSAVHAASATTSHLPASTAFSSHRRPSIVYLPVTAKLKNLLLKPAKGLCYFGDHSAIRKAQLNEVSGESGNDAASTEIKEEMATSKGEDSEGGKRSVPSAPLSEEAIVEFMTQAASLVKLVDSRDIVELQVKQQGCEIIIRKKEALPQILAQASVVMNQAASATAAIPSAEQPPPAAPTLPSPAAAPSSVSASVPKPTKSPHPPLKSPMAGTFYRSPGPGLPAFVKLGDKVSKGQILCLIEAMKLMNEIEVDQSGTVVEILVEDGKPVGIDQPIFVIEP